MAVHKISGPGVRRAAQEETSSYLPVVIEEDFTTVMERMKAAKPGIVKRHMSLLNERYDLSNRTAGGVTMSRGKPIQDGVRVKLPAGANWAKLAEMSPDEIREKNLFPLGFFPLPHPNHPEGGMVFPQFHIDEIKKQEARDLTRFDLDFDLPDHFLPEFPSPIFLTTRSDLGDVSQGKLVTIDNFHELFNGVLNPKQIDGIRLVGDIRPQEFRHRIDTPSLRGVKDSPPYLHDGRLLTLDDTVEFFNLIIELKLTEQEKKDLVVFMRQL